MYLSHGITNLHSFDAVKQTLVSIPVLIPPDYTKYFLLYLVITESTLGIFLVQEDDSSHEHDIYYISNGLASQKFIYSRVEKLALRAVHVVQRLRHHILPRKMTIVAEKNPMKHILSHWIIEGKYSKWILIFQEFDLEFVNAKAKKSLTFV